MHAFLRLALPFLATAAGYVLLQLAQLIFRDLRSPLRNLVGPKSPSIFFGNVKQMEDDPYMTWKWRNTFGATFQFKSLLNVRELYTADTVALEHIVRNNFIYQKRATLQNSNNTLAGQGLLGVEGETHKRQRRVMNPAFGTAQIRGMMEIFLEKSVELRDVWTRKIGDNSKSTRIDILDWLSKMTLDVIGQAGFDYQFDSLNPDKKPNEIHETFSKLFHSPNRSREIAFRTSSIPLLRVLPLARRKAFNEARQTLFDFGYKMLADGKAVINAAGGPKAVSTSRDLFSLILRANMSSDIPEDHRMSDIEVVGQIPTFFLAGHATTSSAIAWALYELSVNPLVQTKLREELFTLSTDSPTLEEINSLPYMDNVIRETLRVHAPVSHLTRVAAADDVLPLGTPCLDTKGRKLNSITIRKGQNVRIPIVDVNTDLTLWGPDAAEFRPERWDQLPKAVEAIPSVWGNMLTFLAGPHNCIGFRLSLAEQKVLLFVLVRAFVFERAVAEGEIRRSGNALQSPFVGNESEKGSQMPLMVRAYQA
ncbi:cytochrome P450 [Mycena metata]|uniref:Cytochrome P450 n=1 Tax=Mycena metata TaxID=1033252 RepID=A0AAD7JMI2_9AGAR|nr:cytochrome P450 [Mycena metata]